MHLQLVVALSLLAACSASLLYRGDIYIDVTRDSVQVRNRQTDREVDIVFNQLSGLLRDQVIRVQINGPRISPKVFRVVDRRVTEDGRYQSEILKQLFYRYSGDVDEKTYTDLLRTIAQLAEDEKIDPTVLLVLKAVLSRYQGIELENLLSQIYRLQEVEQQRLYQGLYQRTPYDRFSYGQRRSLSGLKDLESERFLEDDRYLRGSLGGLRKFDIYSRRNLGLDSGIERDADMTRYIQRENQYRYGLRPNYLNKYGLDYRRFYDREYDQTPRSIFQRTIFRTPEEENIADRRVADRLYPMNDVRRQLYRDETPYLQRLEKTEEISALQRPRYLVLRRLRDRDLDSQRYILGQDETRIPLERPLPYYGVQNQRQVFNRYGTIY